MPSRRRDPCPLPRTDSLIEFAAAHLFDYDVPAVRITSGTVFAATAYGPRPARHDPRRRRERARQLNLSVTEEASTEILAQGPVAHYGP